MSQELCVLYVTFPSEDIARDLIRSMLDEGLIACANLFEVRSFYCYDGARRDEPEWGCLLKAAPDKKEKLRAFVVDRHPYDCPCVLDLDAKSLNPQFTAWVQEQCHGEKSKEAAL